jgi:hypothetical protein
MTTYHVFTLVQPDDDPHWDAWSHLSYLTDAYASAEDAREDGCLIGNGIVIE